MSLVNANPLILAPDGGYNISRSVRLRSSASAYFNRTPGSASNRKTMTLSMWQKRGEFGGTSEPAIMWAGTNSSNYTLFRWGDGVGNSDSKFKLNLNMYTGSTNINLITTPVYRDPSAWYHIVLSIDTTQATAANRVRLYINGTEVTAFSSATYPSQNLDLLFNSTNAHEIGRFNFGSYLDGYMTEVNFVDGQQLTPSSFGETNPVTGVWQPKKYAGTYGTNGFYLNFSDNSSNTATTIGKDYSGNGNNWTPNNISVTSGVTYDSMLDVPTLWADGGNGRGNYAVLNPLSKTGQTVSNGNLTYSSSTGTTDQCAAPTFAVGASGKWYWEVQITSTPQNQTQECIGITNDIGSPSSLIRAYNSAGQYYDGSSWVSYGAAWSTNDVIGIAIDVDNSQITFYKNNSSQGTKTFAWNANGNCSLRCGSTTGTTYQANFGQRPFAYTPPTGFKALNTQNLPIPSIPRGDAYFNINLWTGDQSARTITNSGGMQPDFLWTKSRSAAEDHRLSDSVRGGNGTVLGTLASNTANAEAFDTDVTGFTSSGFNIRAGTNSPNVTGRTYVGWQWKEGATPGFDIVAYTGDGTSPRNISHSLGAVPAMVIVKSRGSVSSWIVKHKSLSSNNVMFLEATNAQLSPSNGYVQDLNNSSTFGVVNGGGGVANVNTNGTAYLAYLFAEVAGFSKFGNYTGNSSTDGPFVFTGFRPRFVLVKNYSAVNNWWVWDTARNTYNAMNEALVPNLSVAEQTPLPIDCLANGFKFRTSNGEMNNNGNNYIYMAFAENPFKNALAR